MNKTDWKFWTVALVLILILVLIMLSSCNAVQGIGNDISWMGAAGREMLEHGHEAGQ